MNASAKSRDVQGTAAFADMIEQAPDAILLIDSEGNIAYANPSAAELFEISAEQLQVEALQSRIPAIHEAGDRLLTGRRRDGSELTLDVRTRPIQSDGREWLIASVRHATQQQRDVERALISQRATEEVARTKSAFLALAAHDLSQPMQSIALALSAAGRCMPGSSDAVGLLAVATSSLRRVRKLLDLLLEIAKLDSATMHVAGECEQVRSIFADLEEEFAPLARAKGVSFYSDPGAHVIRTDPTLVRTLLANLVSNAIRYTAQGQVALRCAATAHAGLRFSVHDTGIGMPQSDLPSIFDEFKRLDGARDACQDGFGLGLAIVRRLCGLLGASIAVESTVGVGSLFTVEFPSARVFDS